MVTPAIVMLITLVTDANAWIIALAAKGISISNECVSLGAIGTAEKILVAAASVPTLIV